MCPIIGDVMKSTVADHEVQGVAANHNAARLPPTMKCVDQLRLSQHQTAQVLRENERLTSQLKEVIGMNRQWQKYDEQREAYVIKLHAVNNELLSKLSSLQKTNSELQIQVSRQKWCETEKQINAMHISSASCAQRADQETSHTAPMCVLDAKMARKEKEMYTLKDEIIILKEQIASLQRSQTSRRKEEEERNALFKAQIEVCMEDFRQERADRERLNTEKLHLRKQLDEAEITITALQEEVNELVEEIRWLQDRPSRHTHHYANYTGAPSKPNLYKKRIPLPQTAKLVGRGWDVPDYDSVGALPSDVEVDGNSSEATSLESSPVISAAPPETTEDVSQTPSVNGGVDSVPTTSSTGVSSTQGCILVPNDDISEECLKCPQCLKEFAVEALNEMFVHIELCSGEQGAHED